MRAKTSEAGTFEGTCTAIYALSQADLQLTFSEIMEGLKRLEALEQLVLNKVCTGNMSARVKALAQLEAGLESF